MSVIPNTEGRYSVNIDVGTVLDNTTKQWLAPKCRDDMMYYPFIDGLSQYYPGGEISAAALVMHAVYDITIPVNLWHKLSVGFSNSIGLDCNKNNLYWRLPEGPIESQVHPGYYYIPEYKWLLVNKAGDVLSYYKKETYHKQPSNNGGGYCDTQATPSEWKEGVTKQATINWHVIVACGCVRRPNMDVSKLDINHIDKNTRNFHSENLEFVTRGVNTLHGQLFNVNSKNMVSYTTATGESLFGNLIDLSKHLGISAVDIWRMLRLGINNFNNGVVTLATKLDITDEGMVELVSKQNNGNGPRREHISEDEVLNIWDTLTNEKITCTTFVDAGLYTDTNPSGVRFHLKNPRHYKLKNRYIVKKNNEPWPSKELVDSYVPGSGKQVTVSRNILTGEMIKHESATAAWKSLGLSKKRVTNSLSGNTKREIDGYQFQYLDAGKDINSLEW